MSARNKGFIHKGLTVAQLHLISFGFGSKDLTIKLCLNILVCFHSGLKVVNIYFTLNKESVKLNSEDEKNSHINTFNHINRKR